MKKPNFKAMALLGITGGITLCSSGSASEPVNNDNMNIDNAGHFLAASCSSCKSVAYQPHGCGGGGQSHGCGGTQPQGYYAPQGSCSQTAYQPHGCGGQRPQNTYYDNSGTQGTTSPQTGTEQPQPYQPRNQPNGMEQQQPQAYQSRNQSWNGKVATTAMDTKSAEETQALSQLNDESKAIFRGLDPAGKRMAIEEMRQSTDKNQAIRNVAQKMSEQRARANAPKY